MITPKTFKDKNGTSLKVGDEVILRGTIREIAGSIEITTPEGNRLTCWPHHVEKVEPAEDSELEEQCLKAHLELDEQLKKLHAENERIQSIRISIGKEVARLRDAITTISEINERPTNDRYIEISNACTRALGETL